ncbi:UDP-2-acetamido-2-deoxy-3-oxo-D-glucuronate aminotransferase [Limihaloglobus sulfuriphilus]|uniref:UDP-2-acetamido-2-deoxy-3-oxo-D-glucuronate aminotransferase n=1 Tax=Limihaloglobus sulfuriphilus TaxID=1851148 RepID=A0A1Q2MBH9_9BACT|nr:DegT/DnrJ/EryC1/StrS family aminotransferase [Limihaloglobus sulfuriphilus]AQQ69888.1 UDP-2-acetamido-2-deoxy-3-oxo-D-glucuronate aminotransferase [Limihaloglobus sulfuriphilus]
MQVPLLDLKKQFARLEDEIMPAITGVCRMQACCLGPAVAKFEEEIADYCHCKHAIGVSSGSDAIIAALMALGIGPGDEVIIPSFTFVATSGAVARVGATPVFADIEACTFNISPVEIEAKITEKTKAIIPVHLFGQIANMEPIMDIARKNNIYVIEDAAQSIGAARNGIKAGNFGDCGCFSFYPTKNLGAFGDGGLITTNDDNLAKMIRMVRNHGQNATYQYQVIGGNFRLDGIQGAVLGVKLRYLSSWHEARRENAAAYSRALAGVGDITIPHIDDVNYSIFNQYTIRSEKRDELKAHLQENQIGCGVYYPEPLHTQQCFKHLGLKEDDLPVTAKACREVLSLPISPELEEDQRDFVIQKIKDFYA